jgi:hypothetical protein
MSRSAEAPPTAPAIPGMIREFLVERSSVGMACSRGGDLRPRLRWLSGWNPSDDGRGLVCLVSRGFTAGLEDDLRDNGEFAATIEQIGPHETYQFKGRAVAIEPAGPRDVDLWEKLRTRFAETVRHIDPRPELNPELLRRYIPPPELVVRLRIREIFLQTPGPGAGRRLVPPESL